MKQLMVISHDTYASGLTPGTSTIDNIASLAVGAWAMVDKDASAATIDVIANIAATSEVDTPAKFQIVTMTANGLKWSPIITKANAVCTKSVYVAPVAKVMNLNNTIAGIEVGKQYGFVVTDLSKPTHELSRNRTYIYTAVSGATEATINAALIALVNADADAIVTASSGTDIVLTGDVAGVPFTVSLWGDLRGQSVVSISTAHVAGTGTAAQLVAYEKECNVERGDANYNKSDKLFFTAVSEVTAAETYDQWVIRYTTPTHRPVIEGQNPAQELVIATLVSLSDSGDGKTVEGLTNLDADLGNL